MPLQQPFRFPDLIRSKREGAGMTKDEVEFFVGGVVGGSVEPAQIGAMLMAIYYSGMNQEETAHLTRAMMNSGDILRWPPEWKDILVDKHSTGGVGDKVSIALAPALAACGLKVPMMSGRGLAFTGGTLDKLESIPGFNVSLDQEQMLKALEEVGCVIVGQTTSMVPADRILYGIRDVTATVESRPLVTASILSKKGAESISHLIMDVKVGSGALFKSIHDAESLADFLVSTGALLGIETTAMLTRMDAPIGRCVGNALEIREALETLRGRGRRDFVELVTKQGGHLLYNAGRAASPAAGAADILAALQDGTALRKLREMLRAQGVAASAAETLCGESGEEDWKVMRRAKFQNDVFSLESGKFKTIDALTVAQVCGSLGSGRAKSSDIIDHSVGIEILREYGDRVEKGEALLRVHHNFDHLAEETLQRLREAVVIATGLRDDDDDDDDDKSMVLKVIKSESNGTKS